MPIIFKGGTCLSKAYNVIDRFSEDLDLAVLFETTRLGDGKRKKLKYHILDTAKKLSMAVTNEIDIQSDRDYNFYQIEYIHQFYQKNKILPYLLIETILAYKPFPCEDKKIYNYITRYLESIHRHDIIKEYELEPFITKVQSLERTFIDKLFALCDYHLEGKYERYSRHLYDIHKIWGSEELDRDSIQALVIPIIKDRQLHGIQNYSCMANARPNQLLKDIIEKDVYKNDYENVTSDFVTKPIDYTAAISSLKEIIKMNYIPEIIDDYK